MVACRHIHDKPIHWNHPGSRAGFFHHDPRAGQRLFDNIHAAMESSYHLSVRAQDASLNETGRTQRQRLEEWIEEQVRPQPPRSQTRQSARHP
jgi:hypothetical protein